MQEPALIFGVGHPIMMKRGEAMNPHLILLQKGKHSLLIRYPDRLHLIEVNRKLTEEAEEKILNGVFSDSALDELGLTRETIHLRDLRGVAVGGPETGETVTLYIGKKKRTWQLSDDSTESDLDAIFQNVERFQAPRRKKDRDWRQPLQDASATGGFLFLGNALDAVCFVSLVYSVMGLTQGWLWQVLNMLLMMTAIGLYVAFPQYYTILDRKEYKKAGYTSPVCHLWIALIMTPMALGLDALVSFLFLDWQIVLAVSILGGVALSVGMTCMTRELKANPGYALALALVLAFGCFGVVGQANHMANPNTSRTQLCEVQETDKSRGSRGRTSYSCTVLLETGETVELNISREEYERMGPGDLVEVYAGPGALGIDYAYYIQWFSRGA